MTLWACAPALSRSSDEACDGDGGEVAVGVALVELPGIAESSMGMRIVVVPASSTSVLADEEEEFFTLNTVPDGDCCW